MYSKYIDYSLTSFINILEWSPSWNIYCVFKVQYFLDFLKHNFLKRIKRLSSIGVFAKKVIIYNFSNISKTCWNLSIFLSPNFTKKTTQSSVFSSFWKFKLNFWLFIDISKFKFYFSVIFGWNLSIFLSPNFTGIFKFLELTVSISGTYSFVFFKKMNF